VIAVRDDPDVAVRFGGEHLVPVVVVRNSQEVAAAPRVELGRPRVPKLDQVRRSQGVVPLRDDALQPHGVLDVLLDEQHRHIAWGRDVLHQVEALDLHEIDCAGTDARRDVLDHAVAVVALDEPRLQAAVPAIRGLKDLRVAKDTVVPPVLLRRRRDRDDLVVDAAREHPEELELPPPAIAEGRAGDLIGQEQDAHGGAS
jgi:hypothetical protein